MTDPRKDDHDLDAAKRKLSEEKGRPFDVDTLISANRAREERERLARKRAEEKLEEAHSAAAEQRNALRAAMLEKTSEQLREKEERFEEAKRLEALKAKKTAKKLPKRDAHADLDKSE